MICGGEKKMEWELQANYQAIEQIWEEIEALSKRVRLLTIGLIACFTLIFLLVLLPNLILALLPSKPPFLPNPFPLSHGRTKSLTPSILLL